MYTLSASWPRCHSGPVVSMNALSWLAGVPNRVGVPNMHHVGPGQVLVRGLGNLVGFTLMLNPGGIGVDRALRGEFAYLP